MVASSIELDHYVAFLTAMHARKLAIAQQCRNATAIHDAKPGSHRLRVWHVRTENPERAIAVGMPDSENEMQEQLQQRGSGQKWAAPRE